MVKREILQMPIVLITHSSCNLVLREWAVNVLIMTLWHVILKNNLKSNVSFEKKLKCNTWAKYVPNFAQRHCRWTLWSLSQHPHSAHVDWCRSVTFCHATGDCWFGTACRALTLSVDALHHLEEAAPVAQQATSTSPRKSTNHHMQFPRVKWLNSIVSRTQMNRPTER